MIQVQNLHKSFDTKKIHRGVSFEVKKGETLTIIGGSGTGKSVLLKQIMGLISPTLGDVLIDGKSIVSAQEFQRQDIQKAMGYVFQEAALFDSLTIRDNVAFGIRNLTKCTEVEMDIIVREKLALVGLKNIEHLKPAQLSGGMRKRVGIARAIALNPKILLYDEPTTGLDPVMSDVISDLIIHLQKQTGMTSIAVTHDMKSAYKISNQVAMLYEGKILEMAPPKELQNSSNPIVQQFITGASQGPIEVPKF